MKSLSARVEAAEAAVRPIIEDRELAERLDRAIMEVMEETDPGSDHFKTWHEVFIPLLSGPERQPDPKDRPALSALLRHIVDGLRTKLGGQQELERAFGAAFRRDDAEQQGAAT
ncbi:MAG: hypothetical protein KJ621_08535 [Proteobacteria bacterium]|nr:hypothetical protein [Pseudomonadota bacterium]MBU1739906.1 hypothetical protein [Pseudomonadota bacterium]